MNVEGRKENGGSEGHQPLRISPWLSAGRLEEGNVAHAVMSR